MLRSVLSRTSSVALAGGRRANGHLSHSNPSTTTSVLLSRLPTNIVENELKTALADVKCRKIELEPGCSLHFASECEAKIAAKSIETKFGTKSFVSQVSMPCLLLQNIPEDISADELAKTFVAQAPKTVHISGSNTLRVAVADEQDALKAITALHQVKVGTHSLKTSTVKLANGSYILSVFNYPASTPVETVAGQINQALDSADVKSHSKVELVSQSLVAKKTVSVRFPSHANIHEKELQAALDQSHPNAFKISKVSSVQKPALFLRNLQRLEAETIPTVVAGHEKGIERIQWLRPGKDLEPHMAVVYFNSEEAAFGALKHIQNSLFDGQKISATYKGASEPAVLVTNLPADATEADVILFSSNNLKHERVDIIDAPDGTKSALVIVSSPRDAKITKTFFDGKIFKGSKIAAEERELNDHAVEIVPTGKGSAELSPSVVAAAFQGLASPKSIAFQTNTNAHISFITVQDAQRALERFNRGDVQLKSAASSSGTAAGNLVGASVSVLPAYVAQVQGLGTDVPVRKLVDHLAADLPAAKVLKADRSALLKFRRNSEVLPGLKQIKATQVSGQNIKAERYRPLQVQGDSAYDTLTSTQDKNQMAFERFNLTILMKDFMHLDPATRYQIAKNMFQRELFDARGKEEEEDPDIAMFAANFTPEAASEIHDLFYFEGIAENMDPEEADRRLFQYYLQLQDMRKYSADFAELSGLLGHADESDNTDWSQLNLGAAGMLEQMQADLQRAHELATEELINKAKGRAGAVLRDFEKSMGHAVFNPDAGSDDEGSDDEDAAVSSSVEVQPSSAASDEFDLAGMGSDDDFDSDFEALEGKDGSSSDSSSSSSDSDENELQRAARKAKKEAERKHRAENMHEESDGEGGVRMVYRDPVPENIKGLKFADDEGNHLNIVPDRNGDFVDESGTTWSMVVIDTDTTQKTLAGGRFVTHRALVVMGNLKGSAGFGMGKGKGPPEALTAACRNAMRNLVHIDLYDNFGLAHDLYGKHNACHCVIRATPASREMVASPLIEEILNRIGIASASVKMIGNRNPYSQVNALFNALSKHQNLDEFAKARGKRYLSIRWAHENNI